MKKLMTTMAFSLLIVNTAIADEPEYFYDKAFADHLAADQAAMRAECESDWDCKQDWFAKKVRQPWYRGGKPYFEKHYKPLTSYLLKQKALELWDLSGQTLSVQATLRPPHEGQVSKEMLIGEYGFVIDELIERKEKVPLETKPSRIFYGPPPNSWRN